MREFNGVNEAYFVLQSEAAELEWHDTRNGKALVFPTPMLFAHVAPHRRVLFDPVRDANPFFHYMEAIWMLSGSNDVGFPARFAGNIRTYSDDGKTMHGAYGFRWRNAFGSDQLDRALKMLGQEPTSRRVVLQMWDSRLDLGVDSKDLPCNTHIYFAVKDDRLEMTVCNRSNDLVWGMLGSNFVHFSILQEYLARALRLQPGTYYHFTNNLHVYKGWEGKFSHEISDWYKKHQHPQKHLFSPSSLSLAEAADFVKNPEGNWHSPILRDNAAPMFSAWVKYKHGEFLTALDSCGQIYDDDWRAGCMAWIKRRLDEKS